jgi:hypothetical protein
MSKALTKTGGLESNGSSIVSENQIQKLKKFKILKILKMLIHLIARKNLVQRW